MWRRIATIGFGLLLALASFSPTPRQSGGTPSEAIALSERALKSALEQGDTKSLLDTLRRHTPSEATRSTVENLVRNLSGDSFADRQDSLAALHAQGPLARGFLHRAARRPEPETQRLAFACLRDLPAGIDPVLLKAAVRQAAQADNAECASVLLAHVPFVGDEEVHSEILSALERLSANTDVVEVLRRTLRDPDAARRALAARVLGPLAEERHHLTDLLNDSDALVKLAATETLLTHGDRTALLPYVDLLAELAEDDRCRIEETLMRLAGDETPSLPRADHPEAPLLRRNVWREWCRNHGAIVDLSTFASPSRLENQTLLVHMELLSQEGEVYECGPDGPPRWRLDGLRYPIAAQRLPVDRVLLAEYEVGRVSERRVTGEILWEISVGRPVLGVERLRDGRTVITCRNAILVKGPQEGTVEIYRRPIRDIVGSRISAKGELILLTHDGTCRRIDQRGVEVSRFPVGVPLVMGTGFDLLPGRRVLIPEFGRDRVAEYDSEGRLLWQAAISGPVSAQRLPGGNTLVACASTQQLVELDRHGRVVWERRTEGTPLLATRR